MEKLIASGSEVNKRIDKFLKEGFFLNMETTRGEIIRAIKAGKITVNGKVVKPSYLLQGADAISIDMGKEADKLSANPEIKIEVIFADENMIVVNKPAGLQVHPSDVEKEKTLVNGLIAEFPEIEGVHDNSAFGWMRPGIVHRLDKDTSGIMVIARNQKAFNELKRQFAHREIEKKYISLVYGHLDPEEGVIDAPIARAANFKKQKIAKGKIKGVARPAITEYSVLRRYADFDLVEARPKTGRMHQIRVHLASIGHPVVGDDKYMRKNLERPEGIRRQFLHAKSLKFSLWGKEYAFETGLPADLADFAASLDPVVEFRL